MEVAILLIPLGFVMLKFRTLGLYRFCEGSRDVVHCPISIVGVFECL